MSSPLTTAPARSGEAVAPAQVDPRRNAILAALPDADFTRIRGRLEPVSIERDVHLERPGQEIDHVYFPITGIASIVAVGKDGETIDTAMIGREGMTGLAVFLGTGQMPVHTMVQLPLSAMRIRAQDLRDELERGGKLVNLLLRYTQVVMVSMAQLILCNRVHRLDQRAARWLLQVHERVDGAQFDVTQEFLAQMIGVQRPSLSVVVRQFKDGGLIRYTRGRVSVADRDGLLARACSCIRIMHAEEARLRDTGERYDITAG
jgi:CRP-like cAMP-binding protein